MDDKTVIGGALLLGVLAVGGVVLWSLSRPKPKNTIDQLVDEAGNLISGAASSLGEVGRGLAPVASVPAHTINRIASSVGSTLKTPLHLVGL